MYLNALLASSITIYLSVLQTFAQEGVHHSYEFEDALTEDQGEMRVWRSEASSGRTLRLVDQHGLSAVVLTLCVEPHDLSKNVSLFIDDIRYCNDGPSDSVKLRLDGVNIARFSTFEKWRSGHQWNVFNNSGLIGPLIKLSRGEFTLVIVVQTDKWGIELDRITLVTDNQLPTKNIICHASVYV